MRKSTRDRLVAEAIEIIEAIGATAGTFAAVLAAGEWLSGPSLIGPALAGGLLAGAIARLVLVLRM